MRRHPRNMDLSAAQMDEEDHVIRHESTECPHLGRKEISGHKDVHVGADKLLPRRGRLALGSRRDAVALEDVTHGLVADRIAEVGQGSDDAIIAPGAILLCQAHHQSFYLRVDRGTSETLTLLGAIKLLSDELAVPGKNGVGLHDVCHFCQGLLSQLLVDLGEGLTFGIR